MVEKLSNIDSKERKLPLFTVGGIVAGVTEGVTGVLVGGALGWLIDKFRPSFSFKPQRT
jgi:ABC-type lipoprotein release transport system permease subunit